MKYEEQLCRTCKFRDDYRRCRRYPALYLEYYSEEMYNGVGMEGRWATTKDDDWCGEWKRKEDDEDEEWFG